MSESFEDPTKRKNTKPNAWETAIWAMLVGGTSVTAIDLVLAGRSWVDLVALSTVTTIACASAYKMYKSVNNINKNLNDKQR